jgi:MFS superfamily sulfate permease-like transporter
VDVVTENKKVTGFGIGNIVAFLLGSILMALVVASTFADWFYKNKESKK